MRGEKNGSGSMGESNDDRRNLVPDNFWLKKIYPDAAATLAFSQESLEDVKKDCVVVLDANVLLIPYRLGATSLEELTKVYDSLASSDRIFLPAQAVREFIKNRADRIRDVLRDLSRQASQIQIVADRRVGFLEKDKDYEDLVKFSEEIREIKSKTLKTIENIGLKLRSGIGSDPVSTVYARIFDKRVVDVDEGDTEESLMREMKWRYDHSIPPGYKDKNKPDEGIGDYVIWKTILCLGKDRKKNCIFVTEDAKSDWWVQSEGAFQPRVELVEEYRRASNGRTLHLLSLSAFLELLGAKADAVVETKEVEKYAPIAVRLPLNLARQSSKSDDIIGIFGDNDGSDDQIALVRRIDDLKRRYRNLFNEKISLDSSLNNVDFMENSSSEEVVKLYRKIEDIDLERRNVGRERRRLEEILRRSFLGE